MIIGVLIVMFIVLFWSALALLAAVHDAAFLFYLPIFSSRKYKIINRKFSYFRLIIFRETSYLFQTKSTEIVKVNAFTFYAERI